MCIQCGVWCIMLSVSGALVLQVKLSTLIP